jgi:hypothetical protein
MTDLEQTRLPSPRPLRRHDGSCRFDNRFRYVITEVSCHCIALEQPARTCRSAHWVRFLTCAQVCGFRLLRSSPIPARL